MSKILFNSLINEVISKILQLAQMRIDRDLYFLPDKIHLHCHIQESYRQETFALLLVFYNLTSLSIEGKISFDKDNQKLE